MLKITIKNEWEWLSSWGIDRMVRDAEWFKGQNEAEWKKFESKNGLKSCYFKGANSSNEEKFANVINQSDKDAINKKILAFFFELKLLRIRLQKNMTINKLRFFPNSLFFNERFFELVNCLIMQKTRRKKNSSEKMIKVEK
jgi:hypothetical protein